MQKMGVGGRCEGLWRAACRESYEKALQDATLDVSDDWKRVRKIPIEKRRAWLASKESEVHHADVEISIKSDLARMKLISSEEYDDDSSPPRLLEIKPTRPKGVWKGIYQQVAMETGESERMVRECRDIFRRTQKQLDIELK
jgi:hypothetical protein|tara:strand:- start:140 stop:565 length:426 start_codon:yes stop_codon:yes gene_type:complete